MYSSIPQETLDTYSRQATSFATKVISHLGLIDAPARVHYNCLRLLGILDSTRKLVASNANYHITVSLHLRSVISDHASKTGDAHLYLVRGRGGSFLESDGVGVCRLVLGTMTADMIEGLFDGFVGFGNLARSDIQIRDGNLVGSPKGDVFGLGWAKTPGLATDFDANLAPSVMDEAPLQIELIPKTSSTSRVCAESAWPMPYDRGTAKPFDLFRILASLGIKDTLIVSGAGIHFANEMFRGLEAAAQVDSLTDLTLDDVRELCSLPEAATVGMSPRDPSRNLQTDLSFQPHDSPAERFAKTRLQRRLNEALKDSRRTAKRGGRRHA